MVSISCMLEIMRYSNGHKQYVRCACNMFYEIVHAIWRKNKIVHTSETAVTKKSIVTYMSEENEKTKAKYTTTEERERRRRSRGKKSIRQLWKESIINYYCCKSKTNDEQRKSLCLFLFLCVCVCTGTVCCNNTKKNKVHLKSLCGVCLFFLCTER